MIATKLKSIHELSKSWRLRAKNLKRPRADGTQPINSKAMTIALELEDCADQLDRLLEEAPEAAGIDNV